MHKLLKLYNANFKIIFTFAVCVLFALHGNTYALQGRTEIPENTFYTGIVVSEDENSYVDETGYEDTYQTVMVQILDGEKAEQFVEITHGSGMVLSESEKVQEGQRVVIGESQFTDQSTYYISDFYRIPALTWILLFFVALIVIFAKKKGVSALIGLAFSILVLTKFIVPQIIAGASPFFVTLIGALLIMLVSMYLAHGVHPRTTVALVSTMITILIALVLSFLFVEFAQIFGTGSEDAYSLQFLGSIENLNLKGLFLGGVVIGTLGVLDDITVSQAAIVDELKKANKKLTVKQLYDHATSVGRDHVASLVNTLVLAYAGAALPIFMMLALNDSQPLLLFLNSEFVAEELVRTLVGSSALILAVPITTILAAMYFDKHPSDPKEKGGYMCVH